MNLTALPNGTRVLSADKFGSSAWTETAHLRTVSDDGTPKSYFLKVLATGRLSSKVQLIGHSAPQKMLEKG